jgi:hypothetical protein
MREREERNRLTADIWFSAEEYIIIKEIWISLHQNLIQKIENNCKENLEFINSVFTIK